MNFIQFFGDHIKPKKMRGKGMLNPAYDGWVDERVACTRQRDVNLWFYRKGDTVIAFDTGYVNESGAADAIRALGINPDEVKAVFLTHADMDHAGGLVSEQPLFPNAKIFLHRREEEMLLGKTYRFRRGPIRIRNCVRYTGTYTLLDDGEKRTIDGITVELIHVPGHTPGHSCYLVDGDILISGDCMAFNSDGGYAFFDLFNLDSVRNLRSVAALKERFSDSPPRLILSGHSGVYQGKRPFAHSDRPATGSRRHPFDPTAPEDVFRK